MRFKFVFFVLQFAYGRVHSYGAAVPSAAYGAGQQQNPTFFYGGPQQQQQLSCHQQLEVPTFEALIKNRMFAEKRFYCNKSNSKWITVGIVPATKMLDEEAPGFYFEALFCGEGKPPMPLGGIEGLASLFCTMRQMPPFQHAPLPRARMQLNRINISISTGFKDDVSNLVCVDMKNSFLFSHE